MLDILLPALSLANTIFSHDHHAKISDILDSVVAISTSATDLELRLNALNNDIANMVDEDRDPTDEDWERMTKRSANAHDAIQGA